MLEKWLPVVMYLVQLHSRTLKSLDVMHCYRVTGTWCSVLQCVLQCVAVCCIVLQCFAVCCSVLQCVAAGHFKLLMLCNFIVYGHMMRFVAVCCSVLQYVAVCCSVLQCVSQCVAVCVAVCVTVCVAVCCSGSLESLHFMLCYRVTGMWCGVVRCVAACCSVLQRDPWIY